MKLTREHFRAIIFYNFRRGLSLQECIAELKTSYSSVKNWFNEFNCGPRSPKDEVRESPPKTGIVSENIDAVRELVMQYRHVTCHETKGIFRHFFHQHTYNIA